MHSLLRFLLGLLAFSLGFRLVLLLGKFLALIAAAGSLLWFGAKGCGLVQEKAAEVIQTPQARELLARWDGR